MRFQTLFFIGVVSTFFLPVFSQSDDLFQTAMEAWSQRAEGFSDGQVDPTRINAAIETLEKLLETDTNNLPAMAKLLECYYFKGDFFAKTKEAKQELYDRGLNVSNRAMKTLTANSDPLDLEKDELVALVKDHPNAVDVCFWSSAMWGLWGDNFGAFQAARKGVAGKIRLLAETVVQLDETAYDSGGYRLLGRLNTLAPKVPFFTGWINRDKAVEYLEKAVQASPGEPLNKIYLAEAIIKFKKEKKSEARSLLQSVIDEPGDPSKTVENYVAKVKAKGLLAQLN